MAPHASARLALVCGAGGFIGHHLVRRLRAEGYWVRGVDRVPPAFSPTEAHEFLIGDLRDPAVCERVTHAQGRPFDEVYQLAAEMGGAGYTFTGEYDADIMVNSTLINLHLLQALRARGVGRLFFSSSACVYPRQYQEDPHHPLCRESLAYPAEPDSEYGWEKLYSERLFSAAHRNDGIDIRIARFHNVFGPEGTWTGGREKAPAAICRKVAEVEDGGTIAIWGDGRQTRSFLYIDDCLEGIRRLMESSCTEPVNLGSEEMVTIDELTELALRVAGKRATIRHVAGPQGVRGRTSDNALLKTVTGWAPSRQLADGIAKTYAWIAEQVHSAARMEMEASSSGKASAQGVITSAVADAARNAASNRSVRRSSS